MNRSPLQGYLRLITLGGCLAMVYITCISSPLTADFYRHLGATEFHFGLLSGLPMMSLFMQFLGAYLANRVRARKPWFVVLSIAARLVYIPIAFLPTWLGDVSEGTITLLIVLLAISGAVGNLIVPLWFSWIGDLVPRRVLNRYWGNRQRYMTVVWTLAYIGIAGFMYFASGLSPRTAFPIVAGIGVLAGVIDILLFVWIDEPANAVVTGQHPIDILMEPFRHVEYRTFVRFRCAFSAACMTGAAFMQIYVLKVLGVAVWKATLIWCMAGLGQAFVGPTWGHIADRFGHRPVLRVCISFKPVVCLMYLLITPATAIPVLVVTTFFDSMLNSGWAIAMNGYMLTMSPRENRSMFIAAITALAGVAGGLGAITAGWIMKHTGSFSVVMLGREWGNYHLIFLLSFLLRIACIPLTGSIREPESARSRVVLNYMRGLWPMRMLLFPVGLYRRVSRWGARLMS